MNYINRYMKIYKGENDETIFKRNNKETII